MSEPAAASGPEALRRHLTRLKALPTLPKSLDAVARALEDPAVDFEHVAELIEVDQAITSQILRLANSAFYSTHGKVARVSQALVVLGAVVTRSLVLSSSVLDIRKVALRGFWEHSLGCAVAAGALAKVTRLGHPEEVSAAVQQSAASAHLLTHRGRAVVFEDHADLHRRIDDPSLAVDETSVLVLKHVGPKGAPGMPEWGAAPIPTRLLRQGVKDMMRISDARMSGTSYGTVVLHVAPESAVGGPLALVRNGDEIELDVPNRRLTLRVSEDELALRRAAWKPRPPHFERGYGRMFLDHVLQADQGCDFDFLRGGTPVRAEDTAGPSHA